MARTTKVKKNKRVTKASVIARLSSELATSRELNDLLRRDLNNYRKELYELTTKHNSIVTDANNNRYNLIKKSQHLDAVLTALAGITNQLKRANLILLNNNLAHLSIGSENSLKYEPNPSSKKDKNFKFNEEKNEWREEDDLSLAADR